MKSLIKHIFVHIFNHFLECSKAELLLDLNYIAKGLSKC